MTQHAHGSHDHHHDHDHDHDHDHAPPQPDDKVHSYYQILGVALKELLIEKGVVTADEVRAAIEARDSITPGNGAKLVARAWVDPAYRERLLTEANAAAAELGHPLPTTHLIALENTEKVHNVVVCTLCSCYPRELLGLPPSWYKSKAYRARIVREPRAVLEEFGVRVPDDVEKSALSGSVLKPGPRPNVFDRSWLPGAASPPVSNCTGSAPCGSVMSSRSVTKRFG